MSDDLRYYETFYGMHLTHWVFSFGGFINMHKILDKTYTSEGCDTEEYSVVSEYEDTGITFLYPDHIKKTYFIEGVIRGQVTFGAHGAEGTVGSYMVSIGKMNINTYEQILFTTGWIAINDTLDWNSEYSIGEEKNYPFRIDAWDYAELNEYDRIFVRVEFSGCSDVVFWHANDATWEDLKIEIPFRM